MGGTGIARKNRNAQVKEEAPKPKKKMANTMHQASGKEAVQKTIARKDKNATVVEKPKSKGLQEKTKMQQVPVWDWSRNHKHQKKRVVVQAVLLHKAVPNLLPKKQCQKKPILRTNNLHTQQRPRLQKQRILLICNQV